MNIEQVIDAITETPARNENGVPYIFLCEHDNRRWLTNSYWMVPTNGVVGEVLEAFNLTDDPGRLSILSHRLRRVDGDPPKASSIESIVQKADLAEPMAREKWCGFDVVSDDTWPSVPFKVNSGLVWLDRRYASFIEGCARKTVEWRAIDGGKPTYAFADDVLVGVVMPVRKG